MYYYEVRVAGNAYHSKKPLTYSSNRSLGSGTVVTVPVRKSELFGFVEREVKKPEFAVKPIARVADSPPLPAKALALWEWMESYYPSPSGSSLRLFMPGSVLKGKPVATDKLPVKPMEKATNPKLWTRQREVINQITHGNDSTYLLHGDTGSGKTRVYAELAKRFLGNNQSVLVLTPEIGLTSQLAADLQALTDVRPLVLHSQLTTKQRRELWQSIVESDEGQLIVGTRSSLFAPIKSLGLVVVDESHEDAYKQEQSPHYHAVRVAAQLSRLHGAKLILGSATPSVVDHALLQAKKLPVLRMRTDQPEEALDVEIVDLKQRGDFSTSPHLSRSLLTRVKRALKNNEQTLLFLNRRGTARLVLCQACGWEHLCPNCDIALTFHDDHHSMRCHTCGLTVSPYAACPECGSPDIFYKQVGTKALISHVRKLFPEATVARFDTDLAKSERLELRYEDVRSGKIDILVGTQLLSKGLDLPKLRVVGIVRADSSLGIPDFSAREKTYQQLHQIIGRVARGHREGEVVIQTYNPDSQLIAAASQKDFSTFLARELEERKTFLYPPFCFLLQITASHKQEEQAKQRILYVKERLGTLKGLRIKTVGPSPRFKAKAHGKFHWQLIVKSKRRGDLLKIIETLPKNVAYNIDPINLL
ncbi:MAG: primosomal protein N' [Candidatus Saccharibacteria bacterium]|nr:primosomal protein N' [Candidatus Saccharibacteria bacterium]